ncbi:hypothetical protein [Hyphomicrobium sp.]|uniref:hypothetical protein n=1 Tax=Hyphomicrobium sp. TaxID=82 RepID=UPI001D514F3B|nr:hypothetical protein [Hyphomicrobium sp.]MBY0558842.1 hypothetical protein [Hyphomicrobium sp.]
MTTVVRFPRAHRPEGPDADIIDTLAELLEKAKSGELQSLVALSVGNGPPELAMKMVKGHAASLIGALHVASSTIARMLDVALEDEPDGSDNEEEQ